MYWHELIRKFEPLSADIAYVDSFTSPSVPPAIRVTAMVAGGRPQMGEPKSFRANLTGTTPRWLLKMLVPSALIGGSTSARYACGADVAVGVAVGVAVAVAVGATVAVAVGATVAVAVGATVAVAVGATVAVAVGATVAVAVGATVAVAVAVGVGVGDATEKPVNFAANPSNPANPPLFIDWNAPILMGSVVDEVRPAM
jgi:hypothetical protein